MFGHMQCSVQSGSRAETGDGSIIFLACSAVRVLRPALVRHFKPDASSAHPEDTTCQKPCRSCRDASAQLTLETSLNIRLAKSGKILAATQTDFDPYRFRSSSRTTPASQSVSNASHMKVAQKPRGTARFRRYELVSVCGIWQWRRHSASCLRCANECGPP